jgi:tRNA (guanine-N7-)-methyltransferase
MRLRNKNWTGKFLEEHEEYLVDAAKKIDVKEIFHNKNKELILDIGCGKGMFITTHAQNHPDTNFIALEKEKTVSGVALRWALKEYKAKEIPMDNLRFCNSYIEKFESHIPDGSVNRIHLNFSDPWPKARHAKYRLTGREYLKIYNRILAEGGEIHIKTDNDNLYHFTLDETVFSNFRIILNEPDLYSKPALVAMNVATEYENKFVEMGLKIKKIILQKKAPKLNGELDTIEIEEPITETIVEQHTIIDEDDPF